MTKEQKQKRKKKHRFFWFVIKLQMVLMLLVLGGIGYYYFGGYADIVKQLKKEAVAIANASSKEDFVPSQTSVLLDANGNLISEKSGEKEAAYLMYEDIPSSFVTTIISIEDKKYYKHHGVDVKAVFRAAKAFVVNHKITQGGSTITMQLAKLAYIEPSKDWQYKVKQIFVATELEKKYSKSEILEFYLNNIYFANGYYGIAAASEGYFNCEAKDLDTSQVAFLLAIPNSPTYYDPFVNFDNTIKRRDLILENLWEDGKITDAEYERALKEAIILNPAPKTGSVWNNYVDTYAYHCATKAMMELQGFEFCYYFDSKKDEANYREEYEELYAACQKELYTGGYKIYTSIDLTKQTLLQKAIDEELQDFTEVNDEGIYKMQSAGVCIDNETGCVVAIVGGRGQDFTTYTLNRAYQSHRQPGSAIKPLIVYTPSFERGYEPTTIVLDEQTEEGPKNASGTYAGEVELSYAIWHSLNTVAWNLYEELTPETGLSYLKQMNFSDIVATDYVLPTALGGFTTGVSPLEMAAGFATIENDGLYRTPTCVVKIVDSNENVIYQHQMLQEVIYTETASRMMTNCMIGVLEEGTGKNMRLEYMPAAGKTGTTNNRKDGWFVGYTRYYTTSIWVGCDIPEEVEDLAGNTYPGRIWKSYMDTINNDLPYLDFLPYAQLSEEFLAEQEQRRQEAERQRQELQEEAQEPQDEGEEPQNEGEEPQDEGWAEDLEEPQDQGNLQEPEAAQTVDLP